MTTTQHVKTLVKFDKRKSCYQVFESFLVISMENDFLNSWNFLMMIVGIGSAGMYGFFAAFRKDVEFESFAAYEKALQLNYSRMYEFD